MSSLRSAAAMLLAFVAPFGALAQAPPFSEVGANATTLPSWNVYEAAVPADYSIVTATTASELVSALANASSGTAIEIQGLIDLGPSIINVNRSGALNRPIILRSKTTPGANGLIGASRLNIIGDDWVVEGLRFSGTRYSSLRMRGARVILRQNRFLNCGTTEPVGSSGACVYIGGDLGGVGTPRKMPGAKIYRNFFDGSYSQSLVLPKPPRGSTSIYYYAQNAEISYNSFRNSAPHFTSGGLLNGGEALVLGVQHKVTSIDLTDDNDLLRANVHHNLFDQARGDGETISIKSSGNRIAQNGLRNCGKGSISLRYGHLNLILQNRINRQTEPVDDGASAVILSGRENQARGNIFVSNANPSSPAFMIYAGVLTETGYDYFPAESNVVSKNQSNGVSVALQVKAPASGTIILPSDNSFLSNKFNLQTPTVPLLPFYSDLYDYSTFRLTNLVSPEF